ncbi:MAG: deoxyguanosinetriphosphate triphosphohydrolase [Candidatus Stahlbacteria bacterium]|nr:deoxyguanosinetriphosphate triphosphohydrolase [Candidatus Stahlbacteria bacterium]
MQTRQEIEKVEHQILAHYAMKSDESQDRKHKEPQDPYRTLYQRDRDRIIHSAAFRRLEYKTQVFINHEADYYRTRLTHTIEVNQIARTIARTLKLNEDLVEAIALAHDIGHTPFGHAGEEALNERMKEHGGFEHNHQGLRVVDEFGGRYPEFNGLNLTFETREGIIKHTTKYDKTPTHRLGEFSPRLTPTMEAQVVNIVDEIAYNSHDLDDGLKANYITTEQLRKKVKLWEKIYSQIEIEDIRLRQYKTIRELINKQVHDVIRHTQKQIDKYKIKSVTDVRNYGKPIVSFSTQHTELHKELQYFLHQYLYKHYKVVKLHNKAKRYLKALFDTYIADIHQLPPYFYEKSKKDKYQAVCDYIAGMTDRFAQEEYERLFLPYTKM